MPTVTFQDLCQIKRCPARLRSISCRFKWLLWVVTAFYFQLHHFWAGKEVWILVKRSLLQRLSLLAAYGITFVHWALQRDSFWDLSPCQGVQETEFLQFHREHDTGFLCNCHAQIVDSPQNTMDMRCPGNYLPVLSAALLLGLWIAAAGTVLSSAPGK